jgi:hypothetical protein
MCNSVVQFKNKNVYDMKELTSIVATSMAIAPYPSVFEQDVDEYSLNKRDCPAAEDEKGKAGKRQIYAPTGKKAVNIGRGINSQSANAIREIPAHYADTQGMKNKKEDTTSMDALTQKFENTLDTLPDEYRDEAALAALSVLETFVQKAQAYQAPPLPKNKADMKALNIKTYGEVFPPYSRVSEEDIEKHTKKYWGPWLACCNEGMDIDAISRQQLRERDTKLMDKLEQFSPEKLTGIIQTKSMTLTEKSKSLTDEEIRKSIEIRNIATAKGLIPEAA